MLSSVKCGNTNNRQALLTGDWIFIGEQWHKGFRLTHDSIFPLLEQGGFLSVRQGFGEPYELTTHDSLIFGPAGHVENQWGVDNELRGSWKIIKITEDSLSVAGNTGIMNFYKKHE